MSLPRSLTVLALATSVVSGVIVGWVGRGSQASAEASRVLDAHRNAFLAQQAVAPTTFPLTSGGWHTTPLGRWAEVVPEAAPQALAGQPLETVRRSRPHTPLTPVCAGYRLAEVAVAAVRIRV